MVTSTIFLLFIVLAALRSTLAATFGRRPRPVSLANSAVLLQTGDATKRTVVGSGAGVPESFFDQEDEEEKSKTVSNVHRLPQVAKPAVVQKTLPAASLIATLRKAGELQSESEAVTNNSGIEDAHPHLFSNAAAVAHKFFTLVAAGAEAVVESAKPSWLDGPRNASAKPIHQQQLLQANQVQGALPALGAMSLLGNVKLLTIEEAPMLNATSHVMEPASMIATEAEAATPTTHSPEELRQQQLRWDAAEARRAQEAQEAQDTEVSAEHDM